MTDRCQTNIIPFPFSRDGHQYRLLVSTADGRAGGRVHCRRQLGGGGGEAVASIQGVNQDIRSLSTRR